MVKNLKVKDYIFFVLGLTVLVLDTIALFNYWQKSVFQFIFAISGIAIWVLYRFVYDRKGTYALKLFSYIFAVAIAGGNFATWYTCAIVEPSKVFRAFDTAKNIAQNVSFIGFIVCIIGFIVQFVYQIIDRKK